MSSRVLALSTLALLAAGAASAEPARQRLADEQAVQAVVKPSHVTVGFACDACAAEAAPVAALLFMEPGGAEELVTVRATDWDAGTFALGDGRQLQGRQEATGWMVPVPLDGRDLPMRVVAALEGHVASRAAFWPQREPHVTPSFAFTPTDDVLAAHPRWDPRATSECDLLLPKSAATPVTFTVEGEPRAWLFPSPAEDGTWTFQFVKPGASILERVSVPVAVADEGSDWSFRLPVESVLADQAAAARAATVMESSVAKLDDPRASAGLAGPGMQEADPTRTPLEALGLGAYALDACPRFLR